MLGKISFEELRAVFSPDSMSPRFDGPGRKSIDYGTKERIGTQVYAISDDGFHRTKRTIGVFYPNPSGCRGVRINRGSRG